MVELGVTADARGQARDRERPRVDQRRVVAAWSVYLRQAQRILEDIQPNASLLSEDRNDHGSPTGAAWAPVVDLRLGGEVTTDSGADPDGPSPYRMVQGFSDREGNGPILRAGTRLEFAAATYDTTYLGFGSNYWRLLEGPSGGTEYVVTAGEWRWGSECRLFDALMVPIDEPLLTDPAAVRRLMDDLYAIVEDVRGA